MNVNGIWRVVSIPDFHDDYLKSSDHVTLRQNGKFVKGEFEIGAQYGTINGAVYDEFMDFDFEGEPRFGEGEATLEGRRLVFELWHYHSDEYTFYFTTRSSIAVVAESTG
jgi:hypothetical protein